MAPVKPIGTSNAVGFHQEYNQEPGPRQDLNPDAVTSDSVLPAAQPLPRAVKAPAARKAKK